jgi:RNA-binding protein YlmH
MQENDELIKKRLLELAQRSAGQYAYTYTGFLSLAELALFEQLKPQIKNIDYTLAGGHEGAERQIVCFGSEEHCGYSEPPPIACVRVSPASERFSDDLSHRDFLGALLNLGIKRATLGDILLSENTAYVFCLASVAEHIIAELSTVKHTSVRCTLVEGSPEALAPTLEPIAINVASERLDAVVAAAYKLSRSASLELFRLKRVYVNSAICENTSHTPKVGDIISVRGFGRFRYDGVDRLSRKGRSFVTIQKSV